MLIGIYRHCVVSSFLIIIFFLNTNNFIDFQLNCALLHANCLCDQSNAAGQLTYAELGELSIDHSVLPLFQIGVSESELVLIKSQKAPVH